MTDLIAVLPAVLGAIVLGTLILDQLKAKPAPVPVREKRPRR
jgi:hypothetical protein